MEHPSPLTPGSAVAVAADVRCIVAPNAGLMTGRGTNTYLLGTQQVAVLDPGPNDVAHLRRIREAAGDTIRWILVTHTHCDHSPGAAVLAAQTGAQLIGLPPPRDGRQDLTFTADHAPDDGERLSLGTIEVAAIHTPGHASNCVCYFLAAGRLLFTGDHVLEGVSPVILPPDGDMSAYLHSLDKLAAYDFDRIAPGHGAVMQDGKRVVAALRVHRLARERKVIRSIIGMDGATIERLTPVVYDDVAVERHAWARLTLEAHLIKLAQEGRAIEHEGRWQVIGP